MPSIKTSSVALLAVQGAAALSNGFGLTPVMGFNTYNAAACTINQTYIQNTMKLFQSMEFQSSGYKFFQLDCGWQGTSRQSNGSITYDPDNFPNGIAPLSQMAISMGYEWSMYTDEGVYACDTGVQRVGSEGYEKQDALQFAGWNVDYIKVDNCYITANSDAPHTANSDFVSRYSAMSNALTSVGIKGMLVCQWGVPYINPTQGLQGPAQWTPPLSTSFRVSDDIAEGWENVMRIMNEAINVNLRGLSGPGHFADMDLLEVGNPGMTIDQQASHFAIWAMFKSALMVSTPLTALTSNETQILQNSGLIAINQDSLGKPVILRERYTNDNDQFYGPLANGDLAVLLLDQSGTERSLTLNLYQYNISTATVTNLWTGAVESNVASYTVTVNPNGCMAVRLSNIVYSTPAATPYTYYEFSNGVVAGGATVQSCSGCSDGKDVGYVGNGGTVTLSGISTNSASQDVLFDYINCDIGFLGGGEYANVRGANISVNGGAGQPVLFPISGYNWTTDVLHGFRVHLNGFNTGSSNTITIGGLSGTTEYTPDFDRIGILSA